ncbi:hypothetical protein V6N12_002847 [Hibiscus sabdariffa]|uniref:non-specific serine/threonine protein kinase n=1 Tax=Hibiscus sabdariffa TaxID=183260 RepID=A0ABR2EA68_9ROSI
MKQWGVHFQGGFAYVYLVKEVVSDPSSASATSLANKVKDPSHLSDDGTYTMKKVLIQNSEQLELVREEIRVSSLFSHPNLLPLLDHAIISIKLCAGLKHMHSLDPPYAHNDVKPGNVLLTHRKGQSPLGILMDFRSSRPARKQIRSRSEALQLQLSASSSIMLMSGLDFMCRNGHLSTVQHLFELLSCGTAQAMQILMREMIFGHWDVLYMQ